MFTFSPGPSFHKERWSLAISGYDATGFDEKLKLRHIQLINLVQFYQNSQTHKFDEKNMQLITTKGLKADLMTVYVGKLGACVVSPRM